jgi:glycosyltransferase involved in cell wall biosynthesis
MRVLWVNSNFMHPTTKGGQIRTLEMLRHLHRWHEIHYVALSYPDQPEGPARAGEYSAKSYPFPHRVPDKRSPKFATQLIAGLFSHEPVSLSRFHPPGLRVFLEDLIRKEKFDRAVVDHIAPMCYFPERARCVLFQHNVEFMIWRRHAQHATDPLRKFYFGLQARRMFEFERQACREAGHVVACSELDNKLMRESFGISNVSDVPTGVNLEYFAPPPEPACATPGVDFVFIGSMDWLANQQGVLWFVREILPIIRRKRPNATFAIAGRTPPPEIRDLAKDPGITVTGTVPDVRPWFWESAVCVVPLLVGGGTRLKIYESMAARTPLVSTTIGAEGLTYSHPENIRIADTPENFAAECLDLVENPEVRRAMADAAWRMVNEKYSWEVASHRFDEILRNGPSLR